MSAPVAAATPVCLDPRAPGLPFPAIHEGRYEPDPVTSGIVDIPPRLLDTVRRAGTRLLRIGVGVWLPGLDPDPPAAREREWFTGRTLEDTADASLYSWKHLDGNLDVAAALGCDVLLCVDHMPASLAVERPWAGIPAELQQFAPGYTFPDGVRNAPPRDPAVFAAACRQVVAHVEARGQRVRYLELWNEPDLPFWWAGSFEEYWAMYAAFARMGREAGCVVGGPSWAHALAPELWRDEFIARAAREAVPLDFYSWHCYRPTAQEVVDAARVVRDTLDRNGLVDTQSVLDEWGYTLGDVQFWGSVANAAFLASALVGLVDAGVSAQAGGLLVDPKIIPLHGPRFMGLARRDGDPNPVFHCLEAFESFQATPMRLAHDGPADILAGVSADGTKLCVIAPNSTAEATAVSLRLHGAAARLRQRRLTQKSFDKRHGFEVLDVVAASPDPVTLALPPFSLTVLDGEVESA